MHSTQSNITLVVVLAAFVGLLFVGYDLMFSSPEHMQGVLLEKIYVPPSTTSGPTPGGVRMSKVMVTVQKEEQWIAVVKMDEDTLMVHCLAKYYQTKNVGDLIHFKYYEGKHFHIKYFAHSEEEDED